MKITPIGAAGGEVTGSCYSVQTKNARILVDCGLFQGGKKSEALEKLEAAFSLMPDRDVAQQIGLLKEDILAATPKMQ